MTPRRQVLRAIAAIEKVPLEERVWIWIHLLSGQRPPADEFTFERNVKVRKYRSNWHAEKSERAAARAIADEAAIYRTGQWRHHQHLFEKKPKELRGKTGDLYEIFKLGEIKSVATVKAILRG